MTLPHFTTLNGRDGFLAKTGFFVNVNFAFSPLPDTSGYQQSEPANVADVGWGRMRPSALHDRTHHH